METATLIVIAALGALVGVLSAALWWQTHRIVEQVAQIQEARNDAESLPIGQLLAVLPGASILVNGANGAVERATAKAISLGLVVSDRLSSVEMRSLVSEVHRDGITREYDVDIRRPSLARHEMELRVRAAPVGQGSVLLLVDDVSSARRVDTVR
ncbi:MAG: two-component system, OmpR family, sensor histidine kinase SenX3, partial [Actinomycetota bacterium]|nr:two-component system, OmpR family, sensor histidine kinase SenX3 [Actinomycetota bacterium]